MAGLDGLLAGLAAHGSAGRFASGRVTDWVPGNRKVSVGGVAQPVDTYNADMAPGIALGDIVLVLAVQNTLTVVCKLADA